MRRNRLKILLAISPSLALTSDVKSAFMMASAYILILSLGSFFVSLFQKWFSHPWEKTLKTLIFSFFVILVDMVYAAFFPTISLELEPYLLLILLSCLWLFGWTEDEMIDWAHPIKALSQAFKISLFCSSFLLSIATFREVFGKGTFWGFTLFEENQVTVLSLSAGAFLLGGLFIWFLGYLKERKANAF